MTTTVQAERVDLSIVVATYNRAGDLRRLLESLQNLTGLAERSWEVIVVDNNSTDDTASVLAEYQLDGRLPLRVLAERRQGHSFAQNMGIAAAAGEIVALTDDDIIVPPEWAEQILDFMNAHEDAACIGGMVKLFNPSDAPISTRLSPTGLRIDTTSFSAVNIPIMGCNMAVRASLLRAVGFFDTDLGGKAIGAAEDLDFLYRVLRSGYPIDYVPAIMVFHNHGRRDERTLGEMRRKYLAGRGGFYCKHVLRGDARVARWAYWECAGVVGDLVRPFGDKAGRRSHDLWCLAVGAVKYLRHRRSRRQFAARPRARVLM